MDCLTFLRARQLRFYRLEKNIAVLTLLSEEEKLSVPSWPIDSLWLLRSVAYGIFELNITRVNGTSNEHISILCYTPHLAC